MKNNSWPQLLLVLVFSLFMVYNIGYAIGEFWANIENNRAVNAK